MEVMEAQQQVLEWATAADSYDKLGFLETFFASLGMEEIHHAKNMLAHALKKEENRKIEWTGPNPTDSFKKRQKILNVSETFDFPDWGDEALLVSSLSRPLVSRREELPEAWWSTYKGQYRGYDVEHVHLKGIKSIDRIRAGKVGIASVVNQEIISEDEMVVYHKPRTFLTNPKMVEKNGIRAFDLTNGMDVNKVRARVVEFFKDHLIIVVSGSTDFTCLDLKNYDFKTFDLQYYYKRAGTKDNGFNCTGMSLRDIYFMEFNEDCQGTKVHSATEDAKSTLRIFVEAYIKRNEGKVTRGDKNYYETFDTTKLKEMDEIDNFFCNTEKVFKDWKIKKCACLSCKRLFV